MLSISSRYVILLSIKWALAQILLCRSIIYSAHLFSLRQLALFVSPTSLFIDTKSRYPLQISLSAPSINSTVRNLALHEIDSR